MAPETKIAFLGGGNMAGAMIQGLLARGTVTAANVHVTEPRAERRAELERDHGVVTSDDNRRAVGEADVIVLAVKPQVLPQVLGEVRDLVSPDKLVVSIVAGVTLATLEGLLPTGARVVRTMPNTPALVGAGATGITRGAHATDADVALVRTLFDAIGTSVVLGESQLDAVTGLSGSGPGYVFLFIEALADGGVRAGLPREAALALAAQTVLGSARMVLETGTHPGALKDMVTSPGGTTIAGVHALERGAFRGTVIDAVEAASKRSAELGAQARKP